MMSCRSDFIVPICCPLTGTDVMKKVLAVLAVFGGNAALGRVNIERAAFR